MIIGISGKIGSGKDTLAEMIIQLEPSFVQKRFADKLKEITAILATCDPKLCFTQEGKNRFVESFGMTIGQMQQEIGTQAMRTWDNDVWIKALFSGYKQTAYSIHKDQEMFTGEHSLKFPNWIISDVRFKNEAEYIKSKGGILVRLEGDPARVRANSTRDLTHQSETDLDNYQNWDHVFWNTGTLEELKHFAQHVLINLWK